MSQNPYETPMPHAECDDDNRVPLSQRLRGIRNARRRWSQRCWLCGIVAVVVGISGFNLSQLLYVNRSPTWLVTVTNVGAICVAAVGFGLILFGPISWFWLH